jgi:hypothetical protein
MTQICLVIFSVFVVEGLLRSNFFSCLDSTLTVIKKITYLIPRNNVSDHWKEKAVLKYAFRLMGYSLRILFVFTLMLSLFFLLSFLSNDFLALLMSPLGVIETAMIAVGYTYLRKLVSR